MTLDVAALLDAARHGDLARVQTLTAGVPEAERRAALPAVRKAASELRRGSTLWGVRGRNDAVGLALLACTTGAAAVTTHLTRWWRWGTPVATETTAVLLARDAPWLPDVVARLADLPPATAGLGQWELLELLRTGLGLPRPRTPGYAYGLAVQLSSVPPARRPAPPRVPLLDRLRADRELRDLVPVLLDLEDSSPLQQDFTHSYDEATKRYLTVPRPPEDTWRGAVVALCGEGLLDRGATADACLRVLLRGGSAGRGSFHLALLVDLDLDLDEVAARQRSYVQLLGEGTGPSVKHAQRTLRTLDEAGRLELDALVEASALVLARPDKGLATTQLGWLDKAARRPGAVDDVLLAVADAFGHERTDVQERAVSVVAKHLDRAAPATRAELVAAAAALAPSVRVTAAPLLGPADPSPQPAPGAPVAVPAPRPAAGWPTRGQDLPDLAEATAALVEHLDDAVLLESVLAGLARLRNTDRPAFDAAMAPVRHRLQRPDSGSESMSWDGGLEAVAPQAKLLRMLLLDPTPAAHGPRWRGMFGRARHVQRHALPDVQPSPAGIAVARMRELAVRLMGGEVAELVAVPTEASGLLDPAALAHRLAGLEAAGREPWPTDLQQALLRLPRTTAPAAQTAADRLRSPAGRALADQLRRGHLDPESRLRVGTVQPARRWMWPAHPTTPVALVELHGPALDPAHLATLALDLPDPFLRAGRTTRTTVAMGCGLWQAALPAHPEVLAAHALIALCDLPDAPGHPSTRRLLVALPELAGPVGPAVAVAVCVALGATDALDRTAGSDAVVGLARSQVPGDPVGRVLAGLVTDTGLKVGRVAGALDDASRAGAEVAALVWQVAAAALPPLLAAGTRDAHRLVATAADAAAVTGARGEVPGLADVAARGGSSRVVTEARRLQQVLAG